MAFENKQALPGRPFLDGSPAGTGTRVVTKCVSIPLEMAEYLRRVGSGNLSKGVRVVTERYRLQLDGGKDDHIFDVQ